MKIHRNPILLLPVAALLGLTSCTALGQGPYSASRGTAAASADMGSAARDGAGPRFWAASEGRLARPDWLAFLNANGTPRIHEEAHYAAFWRDVAPRLEEWARDPRLDISPAFVAALIAKESGFQTFATSHAPANGYPQLTHIADADMIQIARDAASWRWMLPELESWPRHPLVHREEARKEVTDSLVAAGAVTGENEYFFDPQLATRGAVFWLRILAEVWSSDEYPGRYNSFAREHLTAGRALSEEQLLELVTVSYNQGYTYAYDLLERYGADWKNHLNEESADYLERVKVFTLLFEGR